MKSLASTSLISRAAAALCVFAAQTLCAAPGDPDVTFGTNGVVNGAFTSIGLQSDGKILTVSGQTIRRFLANGSADAAFAGGTGVVTIPFPASAHERALAVLPNNKIVVAGAANSDFALLRLNADGTPDVTFGTAGVLSVNIHTYQLFPFPNPGPPVTFTSEDAALGVVPLPDGRFVAVGPCATRAFIGGGNTEKRIGACTVSASGQVTGTGSQGQSGVSVSNFVLLPNGRVLIVGRVSSIVVAEYYTSDGAMDIIDSVRDINYPSEFDDEAAGAAARPDGAVLLSGSAGASGNFLSGLRYLDVNNRWQFDSPKTFGPSFPFGKSLAHQPDGHIILAGSVLARYMPDGNLDASFRTLDVMSGLNTVALQSDGKILTAGATTLRRFEGTSASATIAVEIPAGTPFTGGGAAPVDFGTLNTGATATKTFTVRNTSATTPLHLWKTITDGTSAAEITTDKTFPLTIPPGEATTFTLQWAPLVPGPLSATFHLLNSDSSRRSIDVFLTGYALTTQPEIEVQADGATPLASGSTIRLSHFRPGVSLTFTNAGQQPLSFTPVQTGGSAAAFSYTSPLPASLASAASHTSRIEYLPGDNPVSAVFHFGSNDSSENPFDISFTGDPSTSSATWRDTWFSGLPPGSATGDTQDYDGDGLTNLVEYATFGNPLTGGPPAVTLKKNGSVLELTFTRPYEAITELLYELEWTDTLAAGSWKTLGTSSTVLTDDGVRQQMKFTVPAGSGPRFVRLKVTRVPG